MGLYHVSYGPLGRDFPDSLCSIICDGEDEVIAKVKEWLPLERGQELTIKAEAQCRDD